MRISLLAHYLLLGGCACFAAYAALPETGTVYIQEYRVTGAKTLPRVEVEAAVYPFLGPGRTPEDVEQARAALQQAYEEKGFQALVEVPPQQVRRGIISLKVTEAVVGRLRVRGARYFTPSEIKAQARSLPEGKVVNFNEVTRNILRLNQLPDRRVTPSRKPGSDPPQIDIDLLVEDTLPLHGSLELNNRYSADTSPLRLNGSLSYNNLWQLGHSLGGTFQLSPEDWNEVEVYSAYYLVRFPETEWLSLSLQSIKQESNVSTLGAVNVAGRGEVVGARAIFTLPPREGFFHSLSVGLDYKHFRQALTISGIESDVPITYYPVSANYSGSWIGKGRSTDLKLGLVFGLRGAGSDTSEFDANRFNADGNFIYLRGDLSHTQDLPAGFQAFGKVQGQVSDGPLVTNEQYGGGGLSTVRGYLESEALGDNAVFGTVELRSPSLLRWWRGQGHDWRLYAFADAGVLSLHDALPEQEDHFSLASIGVGSSVQLLGFLNGTVDLGMPLIGQNRTEAHNLLLTFRLWAEF